MQIVRTIIWVLLLTALLVFSFANWEPPVTVKIWQNLVVETKIPAIVVVSFLIGFVPMWLRYRAARWQLQRRIATLEATARSAAQLPISSAPAVHEEPPVGIVDQPARGPEHPIPPLRDEGPAPLAPLDEQRPRPSTS